MQVFISSPSGTDESYLDSLKYYFKHLFVHRVHGPINFCHFRKGMTPTDILDGIDNCDIFLLVLPENASPYGSTFSKIPNGCRKELFHARSANKIIIVPVLNHNKVEIYSTSMGKDALHVDRATDSSFTVENIYLKLAKRLKPVNEEKGWTFETLSRLGNSRDRVLKAASEELMHLRIPPMFPFQYSLYRNKADSEIDEDLYYLLL